ncbi:MAG: RagB/SusD family nutrient uptake outer membrane protein, partial [Chitinophagaceae bacterium]
WRAFADLLADQVVINAMEPSAADPYIQLYERRMAAAIYEDNYAQAYIAIQNANAVLYAVDKGLITQEKDAEFNDLTKARVMGEAYFIRAVAHFELVRLYGHQYGFASSAANSGIVLRTQPTIHVKGKADLQGVKRATVEEVYQQVISDLKNAEEMMPTVPLRRGRATRYAAAAYLARVYFQMNDYANALTEINKVIGSTPGVIETEFKLIRSPVTGAINASQANANVAAAFKTSGTGVKSTENIFDLVSLATFSVNNVMSRKYYRTTAINPHLAISKVYITEAAFANNDGRKAALIAAANGMSFSKKYDQSLMNIPVIRSAELLLDRAEINALAGNTEAATKDINLVRDRAIPAYNINTVIAADKILEEVRRERIRELAFEGDRLHDLRRRQADIGPGDRVSVAPVAWNSNALLFRIPAAEVVASGGSVVQNPD